MRDLIEPAQSLEPRRYRGANWLGLWALYLKEIRRFWKVGGQTVGAPVITSLLYMMVFAVATTGARPAAAGIPFVTFMAPGLIMMTMLNNAFANSSSSLLQAKMQGLTQDFLTPPLSPGELTAGFALGAVTRGVLVGLVTWLCVLPFAHLGLAHLWAVLYFGLAACAVMACAGVLAALWAVKFDHLATVSNFVVMPLTFLSGTFYSVTRLPPVFRAASRLNPMFYLIDGFRYGFIGHADGDLWTGAAFVGVLALGLTVLVWRLFAIGYRLKT
ncbi:MAG TPA: ABC transporter permease [Caulobacteraceae bacterium]|nr:ABC transporter permease [Caulobacteraceae bacterium]